MATVANPLVTRFHNGVTNVNDSNILASLPNLDPTRLHVLFEDFDTRNLTDSTIAKWTDTLNSGTVAVAAANNGTIVLTAANTDEALTQSQMTTASWLPDIAKKYWFKARAKVSSNVLADVFLGLAVIDTTIVAASANTLTDCIGFFKAATDTSWTVSIRQDATTGALDTASVGSITSDTFFTIGLYYDGNGTMYYMVDDVVLGNVAVTSAYWPNAQMSPSMAVCQEGTAGANLLTVDYLLFAAER